MTHKWLAPMRAALEPAVAAGVFTPAQADLYAVLKVNEIERAVARSAEEAHKVNRAFHSAEGGPNG